MWTHSHSHTWKGVSGSHFVPGPSQVWRSKSHALQNLSDLGKLGYVFTTIHLFDEPYLIQNKLKKLSTMTLPKGFHANKILFNHFTQVGFPKAQSTDTTQVSTYCHITRSPIAQTTIVINNLPHNWLFNICHLLLSVHEDQV